MKGKLRGARLTDGEQPRQTDTAVSQLRGTNAPPPGLRRSELGLNCGEVDEILPCPLRGRVEDRQHKLWSVGAGWAAVLSFAKRDNRRCQV